MKKTNENKQSNAQKNKDCGGKGCGKSSKNCK